MIELFPDQPLIDPVDDMLGRSSFAESMSDAIMSLKTDSGFVFGLYGEWGSGKTSTINFIKHFLENKKYDKENKPIIINFNPWWFSDSDQLLIQFFTTIKSNIRMAIDQGERFEKLGNSLDALALVLSTLSHIPVPGASLAAKGASGVLKGAGASLKKVGGMMQADVQKIRDEICKEMKALDKKIVIIIDDIERLPGDEIRQILRLTNAVANFPSTIYILSFDRKRVVEVLGQSGSDYGEDFLEKIIQVAHQLPVPSQYRLLNMLSKETDKIIKESPDEVVAQPYLNSVFWTGVAQFVRTPRQRIRYLNTLAVSYPAVKDHVNTADFLALTALQVFCPEFYSVIRDNISIFCWVPPKTTDEVILHNREKVKEERKNQQKALLETIIKDTKTRTIVAQTIALLFPESSETDELDWSRQRRICHHDVFPMYFRMSLEQGEISNPEIKSYLSIASNQKDFESILLRLADEINPITGSSRFSHLMSRLEEFTSEEIPESLINPIVYALYNVGDRCLRKSDENAGPLGLYGTDMMVLKVIHQLVKRITDRDNRFELIESGMNEAQSIYLIVDDVGIMSQQHGELGGGRPYSEADCYVTKEQLQKLKALAVQKIEREANNKTLFNCPKLLSILYRWRDWGDLEKVKGYVTDYISNDESMVSFLLLYRQTIEIAIKDPSMSNMTGGVDSLSDFINPDEIINRCENILKTTHDWFDDDKRKIVELFVKLKNKLQSQS